ncbi:MAG: hypothetical protein AAGA30_21900 [Planctomycetota bacterium]
MDRAIESQESEILEPQEEDWTHLQSSGVTQKLTRTMVDDREQIHCIFRCDFKAHQDRYILNIPIHPALFDKPEVEAFSIDGESRLRITDIQKHGIRVEVIDTSMSTAGGCKSSQKQRYVEIIVSSKCN